jgi:hypothetical protein
MKYKEDLVLKELQKHIEQTYKTHYTTESGLQALDMWMALGNFSTSCRDAAIKYLFRFGKKDGNQKADLLKAMHFIMYMYQHEFLKDAKTTVAKPKLIVPKSKPKEPPNVVKNGFSEIVPLSVSETIEDDMGMKF